MNILKSILFSFIFFHLLSSSFIFFHLLSSSFIFFTVLYCSCIFFHFLSFSFIVFFKNPLFFPRLPHDFLLKLLCKKYFFVPSRGGFCMVPPPLGPLFFSCLFFVLFFSFSFSFAISFHVFLFFICSSFFHFSFIFLLFSSLRKCCFLFHFVSLFSFLEVPKIFGCTSGFLGEKWHILSWLYFLCIGSSSLFPLEQCTFWVMIRLRVVYGGRRVGQVLPSYQNRQISALDETDDAPQSSLCSLHLSSVNTCLSS